MKNEPSDNHNDLNSINDAVTEARATVSAMSEEERKNCLIDSLEFMGKRIPANIQ